MTDAPATVANIPPLILMVDDEPDLEALEALAKHTDVGMVVSDINMPRMDGLTLLQKLGEAKGGQSTIIVSAYGDMGNIRTAMNRGAFDFLTKPIDFTDLEITIDKTLRDR